MANFKIKKGEFYRGIWENTNTSKTHINIIMEKIKEKYDFESYPIKSNSKESKF